MSNLLLYAIPAFLLSPWLERAWAKKHPAGIRGYETRDTLASLAMGVGNVIIGAFSTLAAIALCQLAYRHRLLSLGNSNALWGWPPLFLGEDLCYYWFHRAHHEVRLLWAAHVPVQTPNPYSRAVRIVCRWPKYLATAAQPLPRLSSIR